MSDFFVGQRVVCVAPAACWRPLDWRWRIASLWLDLPRPEQGCVYRIARLHSGAGGRELVGLVETPPRCLFDAAGFRPLRETQNDISQLQALLAPARLAPVD